MKITKQDLVDLIKEEINALNALYEFTVVPRHPDLDPSARTTFSGRVPTSSTWEQARQRDRAAGRGERADRASDQEKHADKQLNIDLNRSPGVRGDESEEGFVGRPGPVDEARAQVGGVLPEHIKTIVDEVLSRLSQ